MPGVPAEYARKVPSGAQAAQFLRARNIDILNSETVSSIPNVVMVWEMLADLSFFGDSSTLKKEFEDAKHSRDPSLSMVDCLCVESSDLATRYTRGAAPKSDKVKTMAMRKTEKRASTVSGGVFELPHAYLNFLGKESAPVMFVAEPESWILSVVFLNDDSRLHRVRIDLPDRPGAIHEIMKVMGDMSVNVLSGATNVLVYYERMTCDLVVDVRKSPARDDLQGDPQRLRLKDLCNVRVKDGRLTYAGNDLAVLKEGVRIVHWTPADSIEADSADSP